MGGGPEFEHLESRCVEVACHICGDASINRNPAFTCTQGFQTSRHCVMRGLLHVHSLPAKLLLSKEIKTRSCLLPKKNTRQAKHIETYDYTVQHAYMQSTYMPYMMSDVREHANRSSEMQVMLHEKNHERTQCTMRAMLLKNKRIKE